MVHGGFALKGEEGTTTIAAAAAALAAGFVDASDVFLSTIVSVASFNIQ